MTGLLRRSLPLLLLPLSLVVCGLASSPWLRAYPSSVLAVPLFGAAALSVLLPFVVINVGVRRLWQTALLDLAGFAFYVTLVALREPLGYADLWSGLLHGPSQILSFALPLVSPRTLLVAPVALCWLCGTIVGECLGRNWQSPLPYAAVLITFGLSYAGTQRAITTASGARRYDTLLAGALLLCLLLLRVVHAWVDASVDREGTAALDSPETVLPMRTVAIGTAVAVLVALIAAAAVQADAFAGHAATPARTPPVATTEPLTPLSFVAGLRPADPQLRGTNLFTVTLDRDASRYIAIGDVDTYNGDSWSFDRTFRPSGGVVPADMDPALRPAGPPVTQQYTIDSTKLAGAPWMPFLFRPQRVVGTAVNVDAASGMIVPAGALRRGEKYSVISRPATRTFDQLRAAALPGTSSAAIDLQLPVPVTDSLAPVISAFAKETGVASTSAVPYLQAVARDLRLHYGLAGVPTSSTSPSGSPTPQGNPSDHSATPTTGPSPTPAGASPTRTGGTSFAAVLASILGSTRAATPEQYATLVALIARQLNVPARIVTGFRVPTPGGVATLGPGTYDVTSGDAWSWVEIPIQGQGWVVLDPSPGRGSATAAPSSDGPKPTLQSSSSAQQNPLITASNTQGGQAQGKTAHPSTRTSVPAARIAFSVAVGVLILLVLLLVALLGRKWVRVSRRRRRGDPRRRVVGAWQEGLDVLVEAGLPEVTGLTSAEVARAAGAAFGADAGERARALGSIANRAIFSQTSWIEPAEADAAWTAESQLRRVVRRRLGFGRRVGATLRYHRPPRTRATLGPSSWAAAMRSRTTSQRTRSRARHGAPAGRRRH